MFVNNFVRRTGAAVFKNKRMMSGGHSAEEAHKEMAKWYKMTIVMVGLSGLLTVYNIVAHEHEHERHGLPYQKIRSKPYPWKCGDCNLFDSKCWKECREGH